MFQGRGVVLRSYLRPGFLDPFVSGLGPSFSKVLGPLPAEGLDHGVGISLAIIS